MKKIKLECGCQIPLVDDKPHIDFHKLNLDCPKVWEVYKKGYTNSVFSIK